MRISNLALDAVVVLPNDTADLASITNGVYVGGSGDLKVTLHNGSIVTFTSLAAGIIHPIAAKRVHATGTTATSILGVY